MGVSPENALSTLNKIFRILITESVDEWDCQKRQSDFLLKTDFEWLQHLLVVHKRYCANGDGCKIPHDCLPEEIETDLLDAAGIKGLSQTRNLPNSKLNASNSFLPKPSFFRRVPYSITGNRVNQHRYGHFSRSSFRTANRKSRPTTSAVSRPTHTRSSATLQNVVPADRINLTEDEVIVIKEEPDMELVEPSVTEPYYDAELTPYSEADAETVALNTIDVSTNRTGYDDTSGELYTEQSTDAEDGAEAFDYGANNVSTSGIYIKQECADEEENAMCSYDNQQSQGCSQPIAISSSNKKMVRSISYRHSAKDRSTNLESVVNEEFAKVTNELFGCEVQAQLDGSLLSDVRTKTQYIDLSSHEVTCPECNELVPVSNIEVHLYTHRRFVCLYCGKLHKQSSNLKKHIRIHTGVRPFECQKCYKSFSDRSNYSRHVTLCQLGIGRSMSDRQRSNTVVVSNTHL